LADDAGPCRAPGVPAANTPFTIPTCKTLGVCRHLLSEPPAEGAGARTCGSGFLFVQGLEFLTGIAAGGVKTPNMVYSMVNGQLQQLVREITAFGSESGHNGNRPAAASADDA
jgi:hypothetical protein